MASPSAPTHIARGARLTTRSGRVLVVDGWQGEGSYARVYRAAYGPGAESCALKLAKAEVPEAAARLEAEGRILGRLRHPGIVRLRDSGSLPGDGIPFLVLEWLDGATLQDTLRAGRGLPLRQALELFRCLCETLAHLHQRQLVHGDLRPQNVLLVPGRGPVLTDPGARDAAAPPENDVRAAGTLFHLMLAGRPPDPDGERLTPAAGFHPGAVRLWKRTQGERPPPAAALAEEAQGLLRTL